MNKSVSSVVGIILLLLIVIFVNGFSRALFGSWYWDLTEENLYSLSEGTKNAVSTINSNVSLRFYFSKSQTSDSPALKLYGQRVEDLLREYARVGAEKISVEFIDPQPDTEEEEWAQRYGLSPMTTPTGKQIFLGLAGTNAQGLEETIPLFDLSRQEALEYDITKLIYSLGNPEKKRVAIISPLPIEGNVTPQMPQFPGQAFNNQPWFFVTQLKQFADVTFLPAETDHIPNDVRVVMLIHPKKLSDKTLYAVDQFVLRGGNLLVAVDPFAQADVQRPNQSNPMMPPMTDQSSNVEKLFAAWGVELQAGAIGDRLLATRVNAGRGVAEDFLLFLSVQNLQGVGGVPVINGENIISSGLEAVLFPWVGSFKITEKEGITAEPLFRSTEQSMIFDSAQYQFGGGSPDEVMQKFIPGREQQVLAVHLRGKFKTAFPDGMPAEKTPEEQSVSVAPHLKEASESGHVIAVADVDFLTDMYSVSVQNIFGAQFATRINDNLIFVTNAIENLLGSDDLISLRSRGQFSRPFKRVQEIERQAEERWLVEEKQLQAKLESTNARLNELQRGAGPEAAEQLTEAALAEIKQFREERIDTMRRLREVRRSLRQDKQQLGTVLFMLNTFAVPLVLVALAIGLHFRQQKKES